MNKRISLQIFIISFSLYSVWYFLFSVATLFNSNHDLSGTIVVLPTPTIMGSGQKIETLQSISVDLSLPPIGKNSGELQALPKVVAVINQHPKKRYKEFFTIQVLSSKKFKDAERAFAKLSTQLTLEENEFLRIEIIQNYSTVRVGKFNSKEDALILFEKIVNFIPNACLLSAYVKPPRILKMFSSKELDDKEGQLKKPGSGVLKYGGNIVTSEKPQILPETELRIDADDKGRNAKGVDGITNEVFVKLTSQVSDKNISQEAQQQHVAVPGEAVINSFEDESALRVEKSIDKNTKKIEAENVSPGITSRKKGSRDSIATKYSIEVITVLDKNDQNGELRMPSSLFYDNGTEELYVLNSNERRFVVFGSDYFPQNSIGEGRGIYTPTAGAVDSKGRIYIIQGSTKGVDARLTILNKAYLIEKEYSLKVAADELAFNPNRVSVSAEDKVYIVGSNETRIMVLDENGVRQNWLQIKVDKNGSYLFSDKETDFDYAKIIDVTIDNSGNLYFTSERLGKIFVFNKQEKFLFSFGRKGGAKGKLSRPRGLAIDEKQRCIYVIDYMRHALVAYDFQGKFRFEHGGRGWGEGWFNFPVDVEVGQQGQVIVSDYFNHRVQVFKIKVLDVLPEGDNGSPAKETQKEKKYVMKTEK